MSKQGGPGRVSRKEGINRITVCDYKSISQEQSIEIRPLTLLAGANSSGKSSIMQPLLLLKQTLEASYDPGALLLNGPNVRFTSADQLLARTGKGMRAKAFCVGIGAGTDSTTTHFERRPTGGFEIQQVIFATRDRMGTLRPPMTHDEIVSAMPYLKEFQNGLSERDGLKLRWALVRNRCLLEVHLTFEGMPGTVDVGGSFSRNVDIEPYLRGLVHLPGLRGNPERNYPVTAVGSAFPGTFEVYTASVVAQWQETDRDEIRQLGSDLEGLGLSWKVITETVNDTQVELKVGRLAHAARGGARDLVNIADIGFGVSQTLPVLVALLAAQPGQLVYLEQPEIHLHPRAQTAMARVLANAASRGVRVVAETHSALLLLAVQTLVSEGELDPEMVKLHWFQRREDGSTAITSAELDEAGAFGNWPEDFGEISLQAEGRYLDAAEQRQRK